jgi:hypothetical protein
LGDDIVKKVLTIAGSDCSGGAGIQADIKTITAHKMYAMSAITALTAQNTTGVYGILESTPEFVGNQLDCIFQDIRPDAVKRENRDVIGMIRITEKIHYQYQGKWQNVKDIYQKIKKSSVTKGIIGSACVKLREDKTATCDKFIDAKIVFVKDRSSDKWLALLCTDISVSDEEIVRVYGKRWDIEVFFKVCKSYLALAKEYQGRSYDMQVAATTIVFLRYAMLSMEARNATDDRTLGDLFFYLKEELQDIKLSQSLMLLVDTLRRALSKLPLLSQEMADKIMNTFLNTIPHPLKQKLLLCA